VRTWYVRALISATERTLRQVGLRGVIRLAAGAAVAAALLTGCSDDPPPSTPTPATGHGTEIVPEDNKHIAVKRGERFSLVVEDNASVGDMWQIRTPPDPRIATGGTEDYVPSGPPGTIGGGGKRYFVFTANEPGDTSIELYNCFRGCQSEQDIARSVSYTLHVTVS
jgi:predicted secreted protein